MAAAMKSSVCGKSPSTESPPSKPEMTTAIKMSMWESDFVEFELDVPEGSGWVLYLGPETSVPVSSGHKFGRLSEENQGVELRSDKNFISELPLYVQTGFPHSQYMDFLSVSQHVYSRDDECQGYIPKSLRSVGCVDEKDESSDYSYDEYCLILPDGTKRRLCDCMYLGRKLSQEEERLEAESLSCVPYFEEEDEDYECEDDDDKEQGDDENEVTDSKILTANIAEEKLLLSEVVPKCVYAVTSEAKEVIGYIFTIGIWSPDLETFHSDEGYYHVSVILPSPSLSSDFVALLGCQNGLNMYETVEEKFQGRVNTDDLFFFHERAEKYWRPPRKPYVNLGSSGIYMSKLFSRVDPGYYIIRPIKGAGSNGKNAFNSPCGLTGEDNFGKIYLFPTKRFLFSKVEDKTPESIHLPYGGYCFLWGGNLTVQPRDGKGETFRMYTNLCDIEGGLHHYGDLSEYDLDPDKTLKKLEIAMKNAYTEYMTLPDDVD